MSRGERRGLDTLRLLSRSCPFWSGISVVEGGGEGSIVLASALGGGGGAPNPSTPADLPRGLRFKGSSSMDSPGDPTNGSVGDPPGGIPPEDPPEGSPLGAPTWGGSTPRLPPKDSAQGSIQKRTPPGISPKDSSQGFPPRITPKDSHQGYLQTNSPN